MCIYSKCTCILLLCLKLFENKNKKIVTLIVKNGNITLQMNFEEERIRSIEQWNEHMSWIYLPTLVVVNVCFVLGLVSSSTVIVVFVARLRHSRDDRYFIPYISAVDLFGLIMNMIGIWASYIHSVSASKDFAFACKGIWYICSAVGCFSAFLLLGIAIQRYLKVCRPCGQQMTLKYRRLLLFVAFIVSMTLSIPFLLFYDYVPITSTRFNVTGYICKQDQNQTSPDGVKGSAVYSITIASLVFVNIILLVILYCFIGRAICQQTDNKKKRRSSAKRRNNMLTTVTNTDVEYPTTTRDETSFQYQNDDVPEYCDWTLDKRDRSSKDAKNGTNVDPKSKSKSLGQFYRKLNSHVDRFTCMFLTITAVAMVSYIPKASILIAESLNASYWEDQTDLERTFSEMIYRLHILHHTSNSFIYAYFDSRFRTEIKNTVRAIFRK